MESGSLKQSFNDHSLEDFLSEFKTEKSRQKALEAKQISQELHAKNADRFKKTAEANRPKEPDDFKLQGLSAKGHAKVKRTEAAYEKFQTRSKKIEQALESRKELIRSNQKIELAARRSMGGRTLTEEFNRSR